MNLIQAFKFCQIKDEVIYLVNIKTGKLHSFYSETIRKKLDMKKIKVYKYGVHYHYDGTWNAKFYVNTPEEELLNWEYNLY